MDMNRMGIMGANMKGVIMNMADMQNYSLTYGLTGIIDDFHARTY